MDENTPLLLTGDADQDEVLHWLDAHSVSLSQGLPAQVLQRKWLQGGRDLPALQTALTVLFDTHWLALSPGLQPPHLRLTPAGYERLLVAQAAWAQARILTVPDLPATTPQTTAPPAPAPAATPDAPLLLQREPGYVFLPPGQPVTEVGLRNQVLHIFRDLALKPGSQLIAMTISRYWQEYGLRAGDLRRALDILQRDGYVRYRMRGIEVYWELTDEGHAYLRGGITPEPLALLAPAAGERHSLSLPDAALEDKVLGLVTAAWQRWPELQARWTLDPNALIHGLDLLLKSRELQMREAPEPGFRRTPQTGAGGAGPR